ncbi:MAG: hypothetical protein U9Q70_13655 [Chloroflexota bacterium]|nr:hypothetical protein [Chloroflexota bacterium]
MPNIQVNLELPYSKLIDAVGQLNSADLERFTHQVVDLLARRRAHVLVSNESELLLKIN